MILALSHIPKTAGTTLVGILRRSYGVRHCDVEPVVGRGGVYGSRDHRLTERLHPGLASVAGHQVTPSSDLEGACGEVLYYAVLREPYARIVSQYQHIARHSSPPAFAEVVESPWWHDRQTRQLAGVADVEAALRVIREKDVLVGLTDSLDEFLVMLRMRAGDDRLDIRYQRRNVAPDRTVADRLRQDPEVAHRIAETNRADLELWRRVREEVYPAQRERFPGLERELRRFREEPPLPRHHPREILNRTYRNAVYKPALYSARWLRRVGRRAA